jgi:DNA-binding transcriptional ArsR family regulator
MKDDASEQTSLQVFERAAELFALLAVPVRLRIISVLCRGEQNVSCLLGEIKVSQPAMSGHLSVLYRADVLARRRSGTQIFYRIADESVVTVCKAACSQVELDGEGGRGVQVV